MAKPSLQTLVAVVAVMAAATPSSSQEAFSGGFAVSSSASASEVKVSWRFYGPPQPSPLLSAKLRSPSGDTGGVATAYPAPGDVTRVLMLVDASDPSRIDDFRRDKQRVFQVFGARSASREAGVLFLGDDTIYEMPPAADAATLAVQVNQVGMTARGSDLATRIADAVVIASDLPAARRVVLVMTDGHSVAPFEPQVLVDKARAAGVAIGFSLVPSRFSVSSDVLKAVAEATGGPFLLDGPSAPDALRNFYSDPFAQLERGASAVFQIAGRQGPFEAVLTRQDGGMSVFPVAAPPAPPPASAAPQTDVTNPVPESAPAREDPSGHDEVLAESRPLWPWVAFGLGGLAAVSALAFLLARRRRPKSGAPEEADSDLAEALAPLPANPLPEAGLEASFEDVATGRRFPIEKLVTRIGRANTNDVILPAETVSRLHAVLEVGDLGDFRIFNRSEQNALAVNHIAVEEAVLQPDDLVTFGEVTLRFWVERPLAA